MTPFEYTNSIGEEEEEVVVVVARVYNIQYVHNEEFGSLDSISLITGYIRSY